MLFGKHESLIGVDIGSSAVKLAEIHRTARGMELRAYDSVQLPPEAIIDGSIMDFGAVSEAIRSLVSRNKVKSKRVASSVAGHSVIIKRISLPAMSRRDLEDSIRLEAEQYIPDIEDVNLDYEILGEREAGGKKELDLLLVAVRRELIDDYTSVLTEVGLEPAVMDVDAFAVENVVEANYDLDPAEPLAVFDIGAAVMNVSVFKGPKNCLTRDVSFGGNQFNEELQKHLNVSYQDAEGLKRGKAIEGIPQERVEEIVRKVSQSLVLEIERSIEYYSMTSGDDPLSKVVLSGGCAHLPGLADFLSSKLGKTVELIDPFRKISVKIPSADRQSLAAIGPEAAVAVGLALRAPGDK
ncbi:MAG: type IV pilus assembly protein PilM [Myxococcales bacterium]|nr:type IV pilus assembly protein PilM [Myxococcales bacterium]